MRRQRGCNVGAMLSKVCHPHLVSCAKRKNAASYAHCPLCEQTTDTGVMDTPATNVKMHCLRGNAKKTGN